jgi:reverse transcriptase-like protein
MKKPLKVHVPNKYETLTKEINSDDILKGFLGHGLFASKLPDFLTSESFYDWYISNSKLTFENIGKDYVRYENMRHINIPRLLAIPNPFSYANLCNLISENWEEIKKQLIENVKTQKIKISRIHIRKIKDKEHLFEMNYKNYEKDGNPEQKIMIGKQFCVEADISNCFPSIYSHSIPWSLVGRNTAKTNKDNHSLWYNKLDKVLRNTKNEETNGILIGPHVSNLISEILLTKVDKVLSEKDYQYIRNIDDYKCFVESNEEAEQFLLDLSSELKNYELHLNSKKTIISKLPLASVNQWVNRLSSFDVGNKLSEDKKIILDFKRLRALLDLAIELMVAENNSAILYYTFKVISTKHLDTKAYKYYIDYVHHLLLLYPYLTSSIEEYVFVPFEVESTRIKRIAKDLYKVGLEKRLYEACSFSVFWAVKYDFKLDCSVLDDSLQSNDCIFLTLGYIYAKKHKDKSSKREYKKKAKELAISDFDRYWIFLYRVLTQPDLTGDFKAIKKKNISFIKEEFNY